MLRSVCAARLSARMKNRADPDALVLPSCSGSSPCLGELSYICPTPTLFDMVHEHAAVACAFKDWFHVCRCARVCVCVPARAQCKLIRSAQAFGDAGLTSLACMDSQMVRPMALCVKCDICVTYEQSKKGVNST